MNSKAHLYSERFEGLAEAFVKIASRRSQLSDTARSTPSSQLPDTFVLTEDEEIEFDEVESSHQLRTGRFLAQIDKLVGVEYEVHIFPLTSTPHRQKKKTAR